MKVICIDDDWKAMSGYMEAPSILFGQVVTVRTCEKDEENEWYSFYEYGEDHFYETAAFAPLSNIDETELAEQRLQTA